MDTEVPENPAFAQLSANNRGPALIVATHIFLALSVITVVTRCWNRFRVIRNLAWDDWLITVSTLLVFAQSISLTFAVNSGLGRPREDLSETEFLDFARAYYASEILAIPTLIFAKISTILLIIAIQPPRAIVLVCKGVAAVIVLCGVGLAFALAFHCNLPTPWNYEGQCIDLEILNIVNVVWNVASDLTLVALPIIMMRKVHVTTAKRWTVNGLFGSRIIVPGFALASLVTAHDVYNGEPRNITWNLITPSIWYQCMINLSIITACIPCIKRFLADMSGGLTVIAVSEPLEMTVKHGSSGNPSGRARDQSSSGGGFFSSLLSRSRQAPASHLASNGGHQKSAARKEEDPYAKVPDFQPDWATRSRPVIERSESVKGLTQNIIVQTIDYEVNYEGTQSSARQTSDRDSSLKSLQDRSQSTASR